MDTDIHPLPGDSVPHWKLDGVVFAAGGEKLA